MRMARDQLNDYRGQMERAETEFRKRDPEFVAAYESESR